MGSTDTFVPLFEFHGKADGVTNTVSTPARSNTTFNGPQGFPVTVSTLEASIPQLFPNIG